MSKKSIVEFRELADRELLEKLADAKADLFHLRFRLATGQLDDNAKVREVRKDIARLNTLLREREIAAAESMETS